MVAGFALVPLVAGALSFVAFLTMLPPPPLPRRVIAGSRVASSGGSSSIDKAVAAAAGAVLLAVPVTVLASVPAVTWLARRGRVTLRTSLLAGAALGNAPFVVPLIVGLLYQFAHGTLPDNPADLWHAAAGTFRVIASGCFVGAGSAGAFWLIAMRGSDLDARTDVVGLADRING
jgi:hypothetical protein